MFLTQAVRQFTLRIALLAMLLAALAPTLSHAMRAGGADAWVEVCTALGAKWVDADALAPSDDPAPASAGSMEHCPYCVLQAHATGLPPAFASTSLNTALQFAVPKRFLHAPHRLHAGTTAQPRAPPLAS